MGAPTLAELATQLRTEGRARFLAHFVDPVLIGAPVQPDDNEWSFRTGSAMIVSLKSAEGDAVVDVNHEAHVLRKLRDGPFRDTILIGRSETNDVILPHPSVSKLHARARATTSGLTLFDAGSSNGTWVNRQRLEPDRGRPLEVGDLVTLGSCPLQLFDPTSLVDAMVRLFNL